MVLRENIKRLSLMKFKFGLHVIQAVLTIIAWMLTIAVIAKPGGNSSASYWYFFLTWTTLIALAYQALIPLCQRQRTKRFKNVYASFGTDVLFTIFWAAALGAVQVWTASGVPSNSTGYCKGFKYGDDDRCTISFGTVFLGVLIFLLFLIAAGISGYKVWYFRKNGYCITQRPSISNPIEAKYVYSHDNQTQRFNGPRDYDLEKGALTISKEGLHPGRKLSWDAAPLSAPACAPDFMEARPTFRTVNYNHNLATETSPLAQYAPINRRPVANSRFAPPRLQLYGPGDRTPALIMDYGGTTPYGAPAPTPTYTPNPQHKHPPYHVSPIRQDYRGSIANAPYTATYNNNHNNDNHNMNQILQNSLRKGYRSNYASGVPTEGYNTYNRRNSTLRMALPGPATTHAGGYQSAYHTPLPTAMMSPRGATSRGFKRESTVQFYSQQQAFADKGFYAR